MVVLDEEASLLVPKSTDVETSELGLLDGAVIPYQFANRLTVCIGALFLVFLSSAFVVSFTTSGFDSTDASSTNFASTSNLAFTLTRSGYKALDYFSSDPSELYSYRSLNGYVAIIEPNAAMNLYITDGYTSELYYEYSVCSLDGDCVGGELSSSDGGGKDTRSVTISCEPKSEYIISVTVFTVDTGLKVDTQTASAVCLYVRRDVRELSDTDLGIALDAMFTLWSTTEEDGRELYGESFHSIDYFTELHYFSTAWQDADHFNEGLGFLPQHIKLTSLFEKAVQAVDKSFSMPYWDYTIDSAAGDTVFDNEIFGSTTFGSMVATSDTTLGGTWTYENDDIADAAVSNGRWANTKALQNVKFADFTNAFGYLRAPWNLNPSPYLSRFGADDASLPTCASHYDMLSYGDMMTFLAQAPYSSHASVKTAISGVFGCDMFNSLTDDGYIASTSAQVDLCNNWPSYAKELYRSNFISPFTNCSYSIDNLNEYECGYTCNADIDDDTFSEKLQSTIDSSYLPDEMSSKGWKAWKAFVCEGSAYKVFAGDMFQSSSPLDPSFWMIHPTQERLLQAKYMSGGFVNKTWPTDTSTDFVCEKSACYEEDEGKTGTYTACCYGHYQYDQVLDFISQNKSAGIGLTNDYVMTSTDPTTADYGMAYVYDSFAWPHCASQGSDFDELLWSYYHMVSGFEVEDVVVIEEVVEDVTVDNTVIVNNVDPNDPTVIVNDPTVNVNDPTVNVNDPTVNINDPSVPIDPTVLVP